jgi:hypothetical protein
MSAHETRTDNVAQDQERKRDWVKPELGVITLKEAMTSHNVIKGDGFTAYS